MFMTLMHMLPLPTNERRNRLCFCMCVIDSTATFALVFYNFTFCYHLIQLLVKSRVLGSQFNFDWSTTCLSKSITLTLQTQTDIIASVGSPIN